MSLGISYAGFRTGFPFRIAHKLNGVTVTLWDNISWTNLGYGPGAYPSDPFGRRTVVGSGTDYPIRFTFAQLVEFYWRTKSHTITVSGLNMVIPRDSSVSTDTWEATLNGETYEFGRSPAGYDPPVKEFELCGRNRNVIFKDAGAINNIWAEAVPVSGSVIWRRGSDGSVFNESATRLAFLFTCFFELTRFCDGSYWPRIDVSLSPFSETYTYLSGMGLSAIVQRREARAFGLPDFVTPQTSATFRLYDCDAIPLYLVCESGTVAGEFTMGGGSWWGYGGKFDTTTGERT